VLYAVNAKRVSVLKSVPCGERTWRALSGWSAAESEGATECTVQRMSRERAWQRKCVASALKVGCVHGRRVGGMR
jgi:hypothetical protein